MDLDEDHKDDDTTYHDEVMTKVSKFITDLVKTETNGEHKFSEISYISSAFIEAGFSLMANLPESMSEEFLKKSLRELGIATNILKA